MPEETKPTRNSKVLADFVKYCEAHPQQRFWQALRNWSGYHWVFVADSLGFNAREEEQASKPKDTFDWEGKRHGN
jgi:hypothetical protein